MKSLVQRRLSCIPGATSHDETIDDITSPQDDHASRLLNMKAEPTLPVVLCGLLQHEFGGPFPTVSCNSDTSNTLCTALATSIGADRRASKASSLRKRSSGIGGITINQRTRIFFFYLYLF